MRIKRAILPLGVALAASFNVMGQQQDTLISERLNEAVVQGVRADPAAPFAVTEVSKVQLSAFSRTGRELPFLLSRTPGVISWSENGMGTGTSYMRIRGADDSRINVTLDGIALNSPEDQCVFWANMNSYASMLGDIQIQRGIGTSTNGDGAFGGSVSLSSKSVNPYPFAEFTLGAGVYGTSRIGASFSSGLFEDHWVVEGAFNRTATDGYIHGTAGSSGSWYCGVSWTGSRFQARYRLIGNYENTGQAWNGIEIDGMNSYDEIWDAGLGRYNSLVESYEIGEDGSVTFKPYTYDGGKTWKRTTDNFTQLHNILSFAYEPTDKLKTTLSLHYTYGYGWYDELKPNCKLSKFGLEPFTKSDGTTIKKTDLIRQKGLSQNTYGASWNAQYSTRNLNLIGGVSLQNFVGNHFGYLTHIGDAELSKKLLDANFKQYQYYDSDADKLDGSTFLKAIWHPFKGFDIYGDLQYRGVHYRTEGYNDKFYENADGTFTNQRLDVDQKYNFFNPKAGVSYKVKDHRIYASVARAHREPQRNNFTDNGSNPFPVAEKLTDYELGYSFASKRLQMGINVYYMDYTDQFVQNGQLSDIGEALTVNIKDSYRAGIELTFGAELCDFLSLEGNWALSRNRLRDFDEYSSLYTADWEWVEDIVVHYDDSPLAFSPNSIGNIFLDFHKGDFTAMWHTSAVSKMYLDNTGSEDRMLKGHCTSNFSASYTFNWGKAVKSMTIGADVINVFNNHYAASGYAWSYPIQGNDPRSGKRLQGVGFIPQGGLMGMLNLSVRF